MRLLYIANARFPTEKAHGLQIAKMCEAFALQGAEVLLAVPRRRNEIKENAFAYYGLRENFKIKYLPVWDTMNWGFGGFLLEAATFGLSLLFSDLWDEFRPDFAFSRDFLGGLSASFCAPRVFFEMHDFPQRKEFFWRMFLRRFRGIVSTNNWKKTQLEKIFGTRSDKILVCPNGFDEKLFAGVPDNKNELRRELGLPLSRPLVLYTGHLYQWKGAYILMQTAKLFAASNFQFLIPNFQNAPMFILIGGTNAEIRRFRQETRDLNNILILGRKPHREVPLYLKAADALVLPNSASTSESIYGTSPLKLFEYLASGRPIAASDLPSLREILNEENASLIKPDDPEALARALAKILQNKVFSDKISRKALFDSQNYTWTKRAKNILNFLNKESV